MVAAERTLQTKQSKAATESKRIAGEKIEATLRRLDDIKSVESEPGDSRIFPGHYAPVLIQEAGQLVVRPMGYRRLFCECSMKKSQGSMGRRTMWTNAAFNTVRRPLFREMLCSRILLG
jgi:hypothetical protein